MERKRQDLWFFSTNKNSSHCHEIKRFSIEGGEVQKPKAATVPTRAAFETLFLVLSAPLSLIAGEAGSLLPASTGLLERLLSVDP